MSDKELVKTIVLSNNDRFYFSRKYDEDHTRNLLIEYISLHASIKDIPILPNLASQIEEDNIIKSIRGTAAIEGNPLTEKNVKDILTNEDKELGNKRAKQEIMNLVALYNIIRKERDFVDPTEEIIKTFQEIITMDINESKSISGTYRTVPVKVGDADHGGTYRPPSRAKDIKTLMKEFINFINSPEIIHRDPIIRGAIAHYHLALIHPFLDGNGRTARFLEAYIIRTADIKYVPALLSNYYYQNLDDYYWAFSLAEKNKSKDITPFVEFVYKGVNDSLIKTKETIYLTIRLQTLKQLYEAEKTQKSITQRQYDLLMSLTGTLQSFSVSELYSNPVFLPLYRNVSERTAQRDLKKLTDMNLLLKNENGTYELNLRALG